MAWGKTAATFATLLVVAGLAGPAGAASFHKEGDTIMMRGQIVAADPLRLSKLIADGAREIVLESPGGLVPAGIYMAEMIRGAGLKTIVRGDCASACTIMFYAGRVRELSGRLGFHRATDAVGTESYTEAMSRFGAPREALDAVRSTPAGSITWIQ
jgi:hypothetical protein